MNRIKVFFLALMIFNAMMDLTLKAEEIQMHKMRATAYCLSGNTCTGQEVRKGLCATSKKEWLGKTAVIYQRFPNNGIGRLIGIYEIQDTGCKPHVVDVWLPENECQGFMDRVYEDGCTGKVWVQVLDSEG